MHTSRNCVTNYIHMSFTSSCLDGNLHDLISAIDSSILSVDCVEWLNSCSLSYCLFFVTTLRATAVSFLRLVVAPLQFTSHLVFLFIAVTGCPDVDLEVLATAGCPVVGREMLATGFPNDWLDQTMSYQLIQTTLFAMHPRLVDYITVALVWMHCSCLLVSLERSTCWFLAQNHLLNLTKAKRCRINLCKRHRFAIANFKHQLLLTAELFFFDTSPADFTDPVPAGSTWPPPDFEHLT
ncbi:hypothetical protein F511_22637 [Dorcoceras hygrometricum]|uniref:Uncharacterized protein n=1 Tax=Dorcoceras hygrometricum TaxID=472368 RepID=A0A2Z7D6T2_9LAMI|nr:hypothetical protein F511_22637 [Dorcoceras hygrometricum]